MRILQQVSHFKDSAGVYLCFDSIFVTRMYVTLLSRIIENRSLLMWTRMLMTLHICKFGHTFESSVEAFPAVEVVAVAAR